MEAIPRRLFCLGCWFGLTAATMGGVRSYPPKNAFGMLADALSASNLTLGSAFLRLGKFLATKQISKNDASEIRKLLTPLARAIESLYRMPNSAAYTKMVDFEQYWSKYAGKRLSPEQEAERRRDWGGINRAVSKVLYEVDRIVEAMNGIRPGIVDEAILTQIRRSLDGRTVLLNKLENMPPPATADDYNGLRRVVRSYWVLRKTLEDALRDLRIFLSKD